MKLLVCDFDGTYFINEKEIVVNNKIVQNFRKQGNLFMLSSGRSFKSLKEMTIKYNIEYDYLSCCDGSILYDKDDNIVVNYDLDKTILEEFLKLKKLVKVERIQYSYYDDYYPKRKKSNLIGCNIVIKNENIAKSFLKKWETLKSNNYKYDFLAYKHNEITFFCLKNKRINKSSTISYLEKALDINYKDIIVFGDNDNDIEMLKKYQGYYIGDVENNIKNICIDGYNQVYEFFKQNQDKKITK